jgi:hypothetical protein
MTTRLMCDLVTHAAATSGLSLDEVLWPRRDPLLVRLRQAIVVVAHGWGRSDHEIAAALGRERSTISHTRKRGQRRMGCDPGFAAMVREIGDICDRIEPLTPPAGGAPCSRAQREADAMQRAIRASGGERARNRLIGDGVEVRDLDKGHRFHIAMIVASHELARRINKARMRLDAMEVVS